MAKALFGLAKIRTEIGVKTPSKDLTYTIIAGETSKNYCKIMTNARTFTFDRPFTLDLLKKVILRYGKKRKEKYYKSGEIRSERESLTEGETDSIIRDMINSGYVQYITTARRDKAHPNIPEEGLKYYSFNKFKVIECEESRYFKSKQHRKVEQIEVKGKLSDRRCRAIRQIYAQFGENTPFTYEMVTNIPKFYKKMAETTPEQDMSKTTRALYIQAAQTAESRNIDFLDTWNSLIRNNFLIQAKTRGRDGKWKVISGAYKVNMVYVRQCLSAANL